MYKALMRQTPAKAAARWCGSSTSASTRRQSSEGTSAKRPGVAAGSSSPTTAPSGLADQRKGDRLLRQQRLRVAPVPFGVHIVPFEAFSEEREDRLTRDRAALGDAPCPCDFETRVL